VSFLRGTVPTLAAILVLAASNAVLAGRAEASSADDEISIGRTRPFVSEVLGETLKNRQRLSLQAVWRVYPSEGHVPIKGFYEALRQHFADWFPPREAFVELDWPAVEEHYEGLSRRFGFPVKVPYEIVGSVARRAAREGKTETALSAYRAMVAAYPKDDPAREKLAELSVLGSRGPYLGQKPPGLIPVPFAEFLAPATDNKHSALAFSPDGQELYYSVYPNYQFPQKIMVTRQEDGGWTPPRVAEFSGTHQEGGPVFSPDGRRLSGGSQEARRLVRRAGSRRPVVRTPAHGRSDQLRAGRCGAGLLSLRGHAPHPDAREEALPVQVQPHGGRVGRTGEAQVGALR